jgi:hypothetical protein
MSQRHAYYDTECCECGDEIASGEDCADENNIRCPECGGQKKPQYDTCYECNL